MVESRYHHGDLRRALLDAVARAITERGVTAVSVREVARDVGVSHAAAAHHFGDKAGLLTALAAEGHERLAAALEAAQPAGFLEVGVAYVRFAVDHPGHFAVMFQGDLLRSPDEALQAARRRSSAVLYPGAAEVVQPSDPADRTAGVAAWALVHGLAMLVLSGAVPKELPDDPEELTRVVAAHLRRPRRR
jgi:AcrR family transcriptional regulator